METAGRRIWRLIRLAGRVALVIFVLTTLCIAYATLVEPTWLKVRHVSLSETPTLRVIHFTDLHYKGDQEYLKKVVATINGLQGDIVCFTGDLVEKKEFYDAALKGMSAINKPVYAVPGNHDYWSGAPFQKAAECCAGTGGAWLCDTNVSILDGTVEIVGRTGREIDVPVSASSKIARRLLLVHYPEWSEKARGVSYDLILAGHSHGGQICLPLIGPVLTLIDGQQYERGLYRRADGPLYVGTGVGTYLFPLRFYCRPEIVVIDL